jgi:hypothetical protein
MIQDTTRDWPGFRPIHRREDEIYRQSDPIAAALAKCMILADGPEGQYTHWDFMIDEAYCPSPHYWCPEHETWAVITQHRSEGYVRTIYWADSSCGCTDTEDALNDLPQP